MRSTRFRLHVGIEGETGQRDGRGERGGGKESGCMRLGWVGSDAFLLVPFPSLRGQLDSGARYASSKTSLSLSLQTHNSRLLYLPDYRLKMVLDSLAVRSTNSPL
jgi:hypothetical protein